MLDENSCNQFVMYIESILGVDKKVQAIEDTARYIRKLFYELFEDPILDDSHSEEELSEIRKKNYQIYQPVKILLNSYRNTRPSSDEAKRQKKESIRILGEIVSDLDISIKKIDQAIAFRKEDKHIGYAEEANKKSKRANRIAIIALVSAIVLPVMFFLINRFCGNQ